MSFRTYSELKGSKISFPKNRMRKPRQFWFVARFRVAVDTNVRVQKHYTPDYEYNIQCILPCTFTKKKS